MRKDVGFERGHTAENRTNSGCFLRFLRHETRDFLSRTAKRKCRSFDSPPPNSTPKSKDRSLRIPELKSVGGPLSLLMNCLFAAPPPGREADFALVPRTALRLSWAILLLPLRGAFRYGIFNSAVTC